jgi:1-acyl-sn-glycerol-3-phosphate acyltransferase
MKLFIILMMYEIVKWLYSLVLRLFYRVTILNKERVPSEGPLIIFANHNNSYTDGLVLFL